MVLMLSVDNSNDITAKLSLLGSNSWAVVVEKTSLQKSTISKIVLELSTQNFLT